MESIPIALAENAGMDPIDAMAEMQSRHAKGEIWSGVEAMQGKVMDMEKLQVLEPMVVKAQAIKSAMEAATMLLKIDDVIASSKTKAPRGGPGEEGMGMPGGMPGGMPPMM